MRKKTLFTKIITFFVTFAMCFFSLFPAYAGDINIQAGPDGQKNLAANVTINLSPSEYHGMSDVTFDVYDGSGAKVVSPKTLSPNDNTVCNVTYSIGGIWHATAGSICTPPANSTVAGDTYNLTFKAGFGVVSAGIYNLEASFIDGTGRVQMKTEGLDLRAQAGISILRLANGNSTFQLSPDNVIYSNTDKEDYIFIKDPNGLPVADKDILLSEGSGEFNREGNQNFTVHSDIYGKIKIENMRIEDNSGNMRYLYGHSICSLSYDNGQTWIPFYVLYNEADNTPYILQLDFMDSNGNNLPKDFTCSPAQYTTNSYNNAGDNTLLLSAGNRAEIIDNTPNVISYYLFKQSSGKAIGDVYFYALGGKTTSRPDNGKVKVLDCGGKDQLSHINFGLTYNNSPLTIDTISMKSNNFGRQIASSSSIATENLQYSSSSWYVLRNQNYQYVITAHDDNGNSFVYTDNINADSDSIQCNKNLTSSDVSALTFKKPTGFSSVTFSYVSPKANTSTVVISNIDNSKVIYVQKNIQIAKINVAKDLNNAYDNSAYDVCVASSFVPINDSYSFTAGAKYNLNWFSCDASKFQPYINNIDGASQQCTNFILGQNIDIGVMPQDEYGNALDNYSFSKIRLALYKDGKFLSDKTIFNICKNSNGSYMFAYNIDYQPIDSGDYTVQAYTYDNGVDNSSGSFKFTVASKAPENQMEPTIVDGKGNLLYDGVTKDYLTAEQLKDAYILVNQHVTGSKGDAIEGVNVTSDKYFTKDNSGNIGKTDSTGRLNLNAISLNYGTLRLSLNKDGYLSKDFSVPVINPLTQAVIKVAALDKFDEAPMKNYQIIMNNKNGNAYNYYTSEWSDDINENQIIIVPVGTYRLELMKSPYLAYDDSDFGYYMSSPDLNIQPGKEISYVFDASKVSDFATIKIDQSINNLYICKSDLKNSGSYISMAVGGDNCDFKHIAYIEKGTYDIIEDAGTAVLSKQDVSINDNNDDFIIPIDQSQMAQIVLPDSEVADICDYNLNGNRYNSYTAYPISQIYITPADMTVNIQNVDLGSMYNYNYSINFSKNDFTAGSKKNISLGDVNGLDFVENKPDANNTITLNENHPEIELGLVDQYSNTIGYFLKEEVVIGNSSWSGYSTSVSDNSTITYSIYDSAGNLVNSLTVPGCNANIDHFGPSGKYTVKAHATVDGKQYDFDKTINVVVQGSSENSIKSFSFLAANNPGKLSADATGTIDEANSTVTLTVPNGTPINSLMPTISLSDNAYCSMARNNDNTVDFSKDVLCKVIAENGTAKTYTIKVTFAQAYNPSNPGQTTPIVTPPPTQTPTPTTTPSTVPTPTPTPTPADTASAKSIADDGDKLKNIAGDKDKSDAAKADDANSVLKDVADTLSKVSDPAASADSIKNVADTIKDAAAIMSTLKDDNAKQALAASLVNVIKNIQGTLQNVGDGSKAVELASSIISEGASACKSLGTDASKAAEIKDTLLNIGQQAIDKAATVKLDEKSVAVKDNVMSASIDESLVETQIKTAKAAAQKISEQLSSEISADAAHKLNITITIDMGKSSDVSKMNATLPGDIVKDIKDSQIAGVNIKMNNVGFTVQPDTFKNALPGEKITLSAEVMDNATVSTPKSAEKIKEVPVMEFKAAINDKPVENFDSPMPVTFDVSKLDPSKYTIDDMNNLTVYVQNDKTLKWEPVGGTYDPVTKTVTVLRPHFSKYTILKTESSYKDTTSSWANKEITYMLRKGVLDSSANFSPKKNVTREEFATWICKAYGLEGTNATVPFKDVSKTDSNYSYIAAAYKAGIINGISGTKFNPGATITREQMAVMLVKAMQKYDKVRLVTGKNAVAALKNLNDSNKISSYAKAYVATALNLGIFKGDNNKNFTPMNNTTREQGAALLYRVYTEK